MSSTVESDTQISYTLESIKSLKKYMSNIYNAISFNDELSFVYFDNGWYIFDTVVDEKINNSPYKENEIEHFIIAAFYLAENGRNEKDDLYGTKELLMAYTQASDVIRSGDVSQYKPYVDSVVPLFRKIMELDE